jgi:hypothetical protein
VEAHFHPARFQPRTFALSGTRASAGLPYELGCVETPFGLAEEHAGDALLRLSEQRIRETVPGRPTGFALTLHPHMLELPLRWKKPQTIS